jgi:hypothetical protein
MINKYQTKYKKYKQKYILLQKGGADQWQYLDKGIWKDYEPVYNILINQGFEKQEKYGGHVDAIITIGLNKYKIHYYEDSENGVYGFQQLIDDNSRSESYKRPIRIKPDESSGVSAPSRASSGVSAPSRASSGVSAQSRASSGVSAQSQTSTGVRAQQVPDYGWFVMIGGRNCNYVEELCVNSNIIERAYNANPRIAFSEGNYDIQFRVERWWNMDCQAIQINRVTGKERPLIRRKL